jgi:hypothetical protein
MTALNAAMAACGDAYTRSLIAAAPEMATTLRRLAHALARGRYPELQGVADDVFAILAKIDKED